MDLKVLILVKVKVHKLKSHLELDRTLVSITF